jgi:hypothetical protein
VTDLPWDVEVRVRCSQGNCTVGGFAQQEGDIPDFERADFEAKALERVRETLAGAK